MQVAARSRDHPADGHGEGPTVRGSEAAGTVIITSARRRVIGLAEESSLLGNLKNEHSGGFSCLRSASGM